MAKSDISSRKDLELLIHTFYSKVRKHKEIGPIFSQIIKDWDHHHERLIDFWQTNLFFVKAYKGNPLQIHQQVDSQFTRHMTQADFGHWLQLWFETLDELFEGKNQFLAKERARNMAHMMFLKIAQTRKKQVNI